MQNMPLILIPAYGRKYKTEAAALSDWDNGKDFKIDNGGPWCSIRDIEAMRMDFGSVISIRWNPGLYAKV